jgi:hypothetical protein
MKNCHRQTPGKESQGDSQERAQGGGFGGRHQFA